MRYPQRSIVSSFKGSHGGWSCVQVALFLTGLAAGRETCSRLQVAVEEAKGQLLALAQQRALLQVSPLWSSHQRNDMGHAFSLALLLLSWKSQKTQLGCFWTCCSLAFMGRRKKSWRE